MKKIMILGAGLYQLPAIKKAAELGFYVISVDYLPDNVGHKYSHQYVNCSTADLEGVLKAANVLNIDGMATFASDISVPTVAYAAEKMTLYGVSPKVAATMINKTEFRKFQETKGLKHPGFIVARNEQAIIQNISDLNLPVIFKPNDNSGSRGIEILHELDIDRATQAFYESIKYSKCGIVCIEEYIQGIQVGGDGFVQDGKLKSLFITEKFQKRNIPVGHKIPTNISDTEQEIVAKELNDHINALGYKNGPLNFDVIVKDDKAVILELSPRPGGNGIPQIISYGTNHDYYEATIKYALGIENDLPDTSEILKPCASWVIHSDTDGILKNMRPKEEMLGVHPEIFDIFYNCEIGSPVKKFTHSGRNLGYILFSCGRDNYFSLVQKYKDSLGLVVE